MLTISTTYPRFDLEYHWPKAQIEQRISQVQIKTTGPQMEIDQVQSRNELGIGTYSYLSHQIRDQAYQEVMSAIAQMSQEGDEVMNRAGLFKEEMIFADQAKRRLDARIPELNIKAAPQSRPKIRFHYKNEIHWNEGGTRINHEIRPPTMNWQMGEVKIDVRG